VPHGGGVNDRPTLKLCPQVNDAGHACVIAIKPSGERPSPNAVFIVFSTGPESLRQEIGVFTFWFFLAPNLCKFSK
jgi:hypothetical protein